MCQLSSRLLQLAEGRGPPKPLLEETVHLTTADRYQVGPPSVDISALPGWPVSSSSPTVDVVVPGQHTLSVIVARLALPEFCTVLLSHWSGHPSHLQPSEQLLNFSRN